MEKSISFIFNELKEFIKVYISLIYKPSSFINNYFINSLTLDKQASFIVLSSIILTIVDLEFVTYTPIMFLTSDGWILNRLSDILSETAKDRNYQEKINELINLSPSKQLIENIFIIFLKVASTVLIVKLIAFNSTKKLKLNDIWNIIVLPIIVSHTLLTVNGFLLFYVANLELINYWLFSIMAIVLLAFSLYPLYLIQIKVFKSKFSISPIKSFFVIHISEIMALGVLAVFNPILIYDELSGINSRTAMSEILYEKSNELIKRDEYKQAESLLKESLKISEGFFDSEITLVYLGTLKIEDIDKRDSLNIENGTEMAKALETECDQLSQKYINLSSVQLYLAQVYAKIGLCDKAEIKYKYVFTNNKSLPHEKLKAATCLSLMLIEDKQDYKNYLSECVWNHNNEIYLKIIDRIRLLFATNRAGGVALFLESLISENEHDAREEIMINPVIVLFEDYNELSVDSDEFKNKYTARCGEEIFE